MCVTGTSGVLHTSRACCSRSARARWVSSEPRLAGGRLDPLAARSRRGPSGGSLGVVRRRVDAASSSALVERLEPLDERPPTRRGCRSGASSSRSLEDRQRRQQAGRPTLGELLGQLLLVLLDGRAVVARGSSEHPRSRSSAGRPAERGRRAAASRAAPRRARRWPAGPRRAAPPRSGPARSSSRDELASTRGRGGAEDPAHVVDGAALGAVPRREQRAVDREVHRPVVADRRADDGAEGAERLGPGVERAQVVEHRARRRCRRRRRGRAAPRAPPCWRSAPARTRPRRGLRAVSTIGSSEPKPR